MKNYKSGSEWRKWDTHVHTPESVLANEFGSDWDQYVTRLFKKAIEFDIKGIGITDYYLIDGYKKLKNEYLGDDAKLASLFSDDEIKEIKEIYIFPNLEFRITKFIVGRERDLLWNRKVNFHVLLSDKIPPEEIESDFITQLHFVNDTAPGQTAQKSPLTKSNLISFGEKLIKDHRGFAGKDPLFVGMMNAAVDEQQIADLLSNSSKFKRRYLLGLPVDEDLSAVSWNSGGHAARKHLIKQVHFASAQHPGTVSFLLGGDDKKAFISEFGALKPCIWGSDAHKADKLFLPDGQRNTWIKADLCFEGLKQVFYDPISRVKIQESSPQNKSKYQIIDKVRFIDRRERPEFSEEWIELNPDLNTIIGGKSSGKSLLLHHIAKSVNRNEVFSKCEIAKSQKYDFLDGGSDFDFEVVWKNGDINRLTSRESEKSLTYIPQLYINHLAEQPGRKELNGLIETILKQNASFQTFLANTAERQRNINEQISSKISLLFSQREAFKKLQGDASAIGQKAAIQKEIDGLQVEVKQLRDSSGFTEEQEAEFKWIRSRLTGLSSRRAKLETYQSSGVRALESLRSDGESHIREMTQRMFFGLGASEDNSSFAESLLNRFAQELRDAHGRFSVYAEYRINRIPKLVRKVDAETDILGKRITPLLNKVKDRKALDEKLASLKKEEAKMVAIDAKMAQIEAMRTQGQATLKEISALYTNLFESYQEITTEVSKPEYQVDEDLMITAAIGFDEAIFSEFINSFDRRTNLKSFLGALSDEDGNVIFKAETHVDAVVQVLHKMREVAKLPPRRQGVEEEALTRRLLANCYYINYIVRHRGDEIYVMSPGKRGLVLLNLILHLSNSDHPILIDQPEDNLDNRTIYEQLNSYIRQRKTKRQIIMVTHNANLVVSADSECVIVANQSGQQAGLDNQKYKFEYCGGALENTFTDDLATGLLYQKGVREHVCEILEGGMDAFKERESKYGLRH